MIDPQTTQQPLDALPIWAIYVLTVLISLLMAEGGYRLGKWWIKRSEADKTNKEGVVSALVGATLAMLAFLIVFVNSFAADRFESRRQLVLEEANAIGTTYLRAGFLDEPNRTLARKLLPEYVDSRLAAVEPGKFAVERAHSEQIQSQLWAGAEAAVGAKSNDVTALYIETLNDLIDIHAKRVAAASARVPYTVWIVVYFVAFLTMLMVGFNNGLLGSRSLFALIVLVLIFSAVILLIVDLDRPQEGFLQVSQQPMKDLQNQLRSTVR